MREKQTIGLLTIGQAPRPDMTADLLPIFGDRFDCTEAGALDGLNLEEVIKMAPLPGEHYLVTRMADGSVVTVAAHHLAQRMQQKVSLLEKQGASAVLILCTEKFAPFSCRIPVFYPNDILKNYIRSRWPEGHVGIILPEEGQMEDFMKFWEQSVPRVTASHGSPYLNDGTLERAARTFADTDVDLIVLDCMGYSLQQQNLVSHLSGKPVLLSRTMAALYLTEQI